MQPDTYVQLGIDLYIKGKTMLGKLPLESSHRAKNHIPAWIRDVDWMMFTSIKPNYGTPNDFLEPVNGLTWAGDMKKWAQLAGFASVEDQTSYSMLMPSVAIKKLLEAQTAYNAGYTVFLLVDGDVFRTVKDKKGLSMPNHWVLLNSSIEIQRYNSKFKSYGAKNIISPGLTESLMAEAKTKKDKAEFEADIYDNDKEPIEMKDRVYMEAFTWGKTNAQVQSRISATHIAQMEYLIQGYYGYIKAMY